MANYRHVIELAYKDILQRAPDPGGLAHFQAELDAGRMTEAILRNTLLQSAEFRERFPSPGQPPTEPPPTEPPTDPKVVRGAFYYPWYPETWTVDGQHVRYRPTLGYYNSDDPAVVSKHIVALIYAKVDVAIASWWGIGKQREQFRIPLLLSNTRGESLKWALYYEKEGFGHPSVEEIRADLAYIKERYASTPAYARRKGKPVIFVYNADDATCDLATKWAEATRGEWYVVLKVFPGYEACATQPDAWHEYAPTLDYVQHRGSVTISPGFWRADEPTARLPRDLKGWREDVRAMIISGQEWQLISTFNEWGEGTAIEASTEWGQQYLDVLHTDGAEVPDMPPPDLPPTTMKPLTVVSGNRFDPPLLGMIVCCDNPDTEGDEALQRGWPLVDERTIDAIAEHKLNYTHIRLGPFSMSEPNPVQAYKLVRTNDDGGVFDLDQWNPAFWQRVREIIAHAEKRGVYVEVDLIDCWGLDHQVTPWSRQRNIQGIEAGHLAVTKQAPQPLHIAWVRKVVAEVGGFPNVIYQDGNEAWKGASLDWVLSLAAIVSEEEIRRGYVAKLFGSNAGHQSPHIDYVTFHKGEAIGPLPNKPVMVNEYAHRPPEAVLFEAKRARDMGSSFHYWRGGQSWEQTEKVLDGLKQLVETGQIPAVAEECPTLVRWGSKIHNVMNHGFQPVDKPVAGGYVVVDSTPRFGSGRGQPCNDEKGFDACGGRLCEDPRGGLWELIEGSAKLHLQSNGFQCRVGPLAPGFYRLRVSPRPDCRDAEGKPVKVAPNASSETTWTV